MSTNANKYYLKKEIQISKDQIPKEEIINETPKKTDKNNILIDEQKYLKEIKNKNEIILKDENKYEELNNNEYDNSNEIYIISNKNKISHNRRKQHQPIYTKIRTESCRNPKATISTYIYKSGKVFQKKTNMKSNLNNYIMETAKYSIKNPIKEKSKNKLKKNKINETDINNINLNTDDYNINNTNYIYKRENDIAELNDVNLNYENNDNYINIVTKTKKLKNSKITLQQPPKTSYISFNDYNELQDAKKKFVPNTIKGEGRIAYICDYSQENNKDSYYVESPTKYNNHISIHPIKGKLKNRKNKKNKKYEDKLKKEIEDSKRKFEKIREIEREIKNYFNLNGLDILNRELYDQSATMIQATFRAYFFRKNLYEKLNLYINIKSGIDILRDIFIPKKIFYWETFINSIFEYITILNTNNIIIDNNEDNQFNLKNEKYQYLNDEFNEAENNKIKYIKKIPNSYKYTKKIKNDSGGGVCLISQSCISFNLNSITNLNNNEQLLNKIIKENEELKKINDELRNNNKSIPSNNNFIKDTQESVELKLSEELKAITSNSSDIKMDKLKYVLKLINLKYKEQIYKYFMKLYNYMILLKYVSNENNNLRNITKNKIIKRLIFNKEKNMKNLKDKKFNEFYYKGLINVIKAKNDNNNNKAKDKKEEEKENENNKIEEKESFGEIKKNE